VRRTVDSHLRAWRVDSGRKPLLIRGARQVGKTYTARALGTTFDELVEVNFEREPALARVFEADLDPRRVVRDLRLVTRKRIEPGRSLLFLDEIQESPQAVRALRYFFEELPELHVVAAGSLVDFALEATGSPVGRVQSVYMYPLSFAEFLSATGNEALARALGAVRDVRPPVHDLLLRELGTYLATGGMPEAVASWVGHGDLARCRRVLAGLADNYRNDFAKYAGHHQIKYVDLLFKEAASMQGRRFVYAHVPGEHRARELAPALGLLEKAGVLHRVLQSPGSGCPLRAGARPDRFKIVFLDVGLTQALLGLETSELILDPATAITHRGATAEAFVGQEMIAYGSPWAGRELFYWHREARGSSAEVDYLFEDDGKVIPIEVKSGGRGRLTSMRLFLEKNRALSPFGIRFSLHPFSIVDDLQSWPLYAVAGLLAERP
jgi:predicted AAA+ superfamily ATPase